MNAFLDLANRIAAIRETERDLERLIRELAPGITGPQVEAIVVLYHADRPLSMSEMCSDIGAACPTATDLVDRLERNGWVRRVRDSEDRRVIRLELTDQALALVEGRQAVSA